MRTSLTTLSFYMFVKKETDVKNIVQEKKKSLNYKTYSN